jgi:tetratricopeptide (TPR) repeat protein
MGTKLGNQNPQYADILKMLPHFIFHKRNTPKHLVYLLRPKPSGALKPELKPISTRPTFTLTGDVYYATKNYKRAEEFYTQAKKIYEDYFSKTHPEYVKILSKQAKVYYMEKNYKRAKQTLRRP